MFSSGSLDWKNIVSGGGLFKNLYKARAEGLKPLVSGLLRQGAGQATSKDDALELSEPLRLLQQSGLDLDRSRLRAEAQQIDFSFAFQDEHVRNLTADGFLDVRSQTLKMDFSFQSSLKTLDPVTGEEREEVFLFELHLEAASFQVREGRREVRKEDILGFARRLLDKVSEMRADGREIDGLALDGEDLRDLGAVDGGELLEQIGHLIDLVRSLDRFNGKKGPHDWLKLARQGVSQQTETSYNSRNISLSLTVNRMEAGIFATEAQNDAEAVSEVSVQNSAATETGTAP